MSLFHMQMHQSYPLQHNARQGDVHEKVKRFSHLFGVKQGDNLSHLGCNVHGKIQSLV